MPHAIIHANDTIRPKAFMQSALAQLKGNRQGAEGSAAEGRGDRLDNFIQKLSADYPAGGRRAACIVVNDAERLPAALLASLLNAQAFSGANVTWVLISQQDWGAGAFNKPELGLPRLATLHFRAYSKEGLAQVLAVRQQDAASRRAFESRLPVLHRVTRRLDDLQLSAQALHAARTAASASRHRAGAAGSSSPSVSRAVMQDNARASQQDIAEAFASGMDATAGPPDNRDNRGEEGTGLCLSLFAQGLLVAAFIASRTKETMDRASFDPTARRKRKRKRLAHDIQTEEAHEAKLKGRHFFGLERLLNVFWCLLDVLAQTSDSAALADLRPQEQQSAEVLTQLSWLVHLRLLSQSGDLLEGACYSCNVTDGLAQSLAQQLGLELRQYVQ